MRETDRQTEEREREREMPNQSLYEHFKVSPKEKIGDFRVTS